MTDKYQNKYRIPSARHPTWDYRKQAAYFITICTAHREHYFGEIENKKIQLSPVGVLADVFWHQIPQHHTGVRLDAFVVMPNHVHGILILDGSSFAVETLPATSLSNTDTEKESKKMSKISPKTGSISTIIRSYKSVVTREAKRLGFQFGWQTRFHDHIIRNDASYERIRNYITNNPENWDSDKFFGDK